MGPWIRSLPPRRAWKDAEQFRESPFWFWVIEILGALVFAGVGVWLTPDSASKARSALYPAIGVLLGLGLAYGLIFLISLALAPIRQRNEARQAYAANEAEKERRIGELQERLRPKLELLYGEGHPYRQDNMGETVYRIGVRNSGGVTFNRVVVKLEQIAPFPAGLTLPYVLHKMHDNPQPGTPFLLDFVLTPDQTEYVDVIRAKYMAVALPNPTFEIFTAVPGVIQHVPLGRYEMRVSVYGDQTHSVASDFVLDFDDSGMALFRPKSD